MKLSRDFDRLVGLYEYPSPSGEELVLAALL